MIMSNPLVVSPEYTECLEKLLKPDSCNTLKNELIEIFCGFWVFEYALWVKTKIWK